MMVTRPDPRLPEIVSAAVDGGVNMVQVRGSDPEAICAAVGDRARVVVNSCGAGFQPAPPSIATERRLEACATRWGVHLPESAPFVDVPYVGRSVHSLEAAMKAQAEGCHYVVAGTIFPSASHPEGPVAGTRLISEMVKKLTIPIVAIGGITPANARACIDAGASGVAVISYLMNAADPTAAARALVNACN